MGWVGLANEKKLLLSHPHHSNNPKWYYQVGKAILRSELKQLVIESVTETVKPSRVGIQASRLPASHHAAF